MKLNTSYIIAAVLVLLGAIWFAFNNSHQPAATPVSTPAIAKDNARQSMPNVLVRRARATEHPNVIELYGQSSANREVELKAETIGLVAEIFVKEGDRVQKDQVVCRQDLNAREAVVDQAKANMRQIETDLRPPSLQNGGSLGEERDGLGSDN